MSFSCTLYRISEILFHDLETGTVKPNALVTKSKGFVTFENSCDAILFVLRKKAGIDSADFVNEIFYPTEKTGSVSDDYFRALMESGNYKELDRISSSTLYFLPPPKVEALHSFLETLDESEIRMLYDPDELNVNNIYPALWNSGEDQRKAYNFYHLQNDVVSLKEFYRTATKEKDYILSFYE